MILTPKFIRAAVYGANDGIITTFAVVAGAAGAQLSPRVILILGLANLIGDGVSMGLGDFLGERSEQKLRQQTNLKYQTVRLWETGLITFVAFILAGSLPLLPYLIEAIMGVTVARSQLLLSVFATACSLFIIGSLRTFVIKGSWIRNGLEMLLVGTLAASVAYLTGGMVAKALVM